MRKAHVLIIVQNLSVPYDRRVWLECNSLIDAGFDVSVICPRAQGDKKHETINGVEIHRYAPPRETRGVLSFFIEFAYCFIRTLLLSIKVHASKKIDVIQTCNPPDTYWLLGLFFRPLGASFVFDQHDLCPEVFDARFGKENIGFAKKFLRRALLMCERANYATATEVISTNESYRSIAMDRGNKNSDNVTVVRSGPNPDRLYPVDEEIVLKRNHKHLIVYIGVMGPQDRVDIAIDAMKHIVHDEGRTDIAFALLGDGDCFNELKEQTRMLELEDHIEFVGRAGDEKIRSYFSTATLGVAPDPATRFNSHSTHNKIMEYMIFSLPVVCFHLNETIVSGGDALNVVEVNADPLAFAKGILEIVDDEERARRMGEYGRHRVMSSLIWDFQAPAYVSTIRKAFLQSKRGKLFAESRGPTFPNVTNP